MRVLEQLEPQGVFRFFEELCAIPHGSRNCQAVSDWCAAFARERGLECHQDQAGNVIIIQEATPGYEAAAPVILQGHLDMVCEKEPGCTKDMAGEGLDLLVEDGCVRAKGTTLGGDDGIAVAMALAILDDQAIPHPRLEVVLTTDEEIGMLGAEALDAAPLRGRKLINVDSEEEGIFTVSCAGGSMAQCTLPVTRAPYGGAALEVTVRGRRRAAERTTPSPWRRPPRWWYLTMPSPGRRRRHWPRISPGNIPQRTRASAWRRRPAPCGRRLWTGRPQSGQSACSPACPTASRP